MEKQTAISNPNQYTLTLGEELESGVFNPTRLTVARKRRGLSKTEVATEIKVDLRSISAFESGEFGPSEETVADLSKALQFPREFFFGPTLHEPTPDTASFRAQSKMSAWQRDMALGQGTLALHLNEWLEKRFELPESSLPNLNSLQDPEAAAEALRQEWGLGVGPIRNVVHLLESRGVRVFALSVKAKEVDAFSMWRADTPLVFLNTQKSAEHSRFDAAHELAHLVLHRHAAPQGRISEKEADSFASAFLMPRASVLANVPRLTTVEQLVRLKKIWSVSVAALAYRFHALRLLTDWHYRSIYIEISKRGYSKKEPNPCAHETSQLLYKVFTALSAEGVTRQAVARDLAINPLELEDLLLGLGFGRLAGGKPLQSTRSEGTQNLTRVK